MSMTDPIADMLTRIRNASAVSHSSVTIPFSKFKENLAKVLEREGYIRGHSTTANADGHRQLVVELKYFEGQPVIQLIERLSKPGRRLYSKIADLPSVRNGLGTAILSTSRGLLSDAEAREQNVGGELVCRVF